MKALVGAFNQEKALVGAFSVIRQPVVEPMDRFAALVLSVCRVLLVLVRVWEEGGKKVAGNWRGHGAVGHRPDDSL